MHTPTVPELSDFASILGLVITVVSFVWSRRKLDQRRSSGATRKRTLNRAIRAVVGSFVRAAQHRSYRRSLRRPTTVVLEQLSVEGFVNMLAKALENVASSSEQRTQEIRVCLLTGASTISLVEKAIPELERLTQVHWKIRILILAPDSPLVDTIERASTSAVRGSIDKLNQLKHDAATEHWNCSIDWATYVEPPTKTGVLIGDADLFVRHTAWKDGKIAAGRVTLEHVGRAAETGPGQIEGFATWFDRMWEGASITA